VDFVFGGGAESSRVEVELGRLERYDVPSGVLDGEDTFCDLNAHMVSGVMLGVLLSVGEIGF